jgi:hypothetical protein
MENKELIFTVMVTSPDLLERYGITMIFLRLILR